MIKSDQKWLITFDHFSFLFVKKTLFHIIYLCSAAFYSSKQSKPTRGLRSENEEASRNFEEHLEKGECAKGCLEKGTYPKACLEKGSQRKGKHQKLEKVGGDVPQGEGPSHC